MIKSEVMTACHNLIFRRSERAVDYIEHSIDIRRHGAVQYIFSNSIALRVLRRTLKATWLIDWPIASPNWKKGILLYVVCTLYMRRNWKATFTFISIRRKLFLFHLFHAVIEQRSIDGNGFLAQGAAKNWHFCTFLSYIKDLVVWVNDIICGDNFFASIFFKIIFQFQQTSS